MRLLERIFFHYDDMIAFLRREKTLSTYLISADASFSWTSFFSLSGNKLLSWTIFMARPERGIELRMSKTESSVWNSLAIHARISTATKESTVRQSVWAYRR